jgi:hypothetical protein
MVYAIFMCVGLIGQPPIKCTPRREAYSSIAECEEARKHVRPDRDNGRSQLRVVCMETPEAPVWQRPGYRYNYRG